MTTSALSVLAVGIAVAVSTSAAAQPVRENEDPPASDHTAADAAGAPVPGEESGQVETDDRDSTARILGRGVLYVPKLALEGAFAPVRAGVWAYDHYHVNARFKDVFFNDAGTVGLYPVAQLESEYGVNVGARFVARDLAGAREHLALHAGYGGRFRTIASARLTSGRRLGRFALALDGQYEKRPHDAFYGIGNATTDEARFRQRLLRTALVGDLAITREFHVRGSGALADFTLGTSDEGTPIDELYPMESMAGWDGVRHAYGELELVWDTRRPEQPWEDPVIRSSGWLVSGFGGRVTALDDNADYYRGGIDLQRFVRLGRGPRVLSARLYGEATSGSLDEVPFTQLPRLGGKTLLRGYARDRFRDRVAALGSVEYAWDLNRYLSASTFVDIGRVFPSLAELSSDQLRVGYGVALEARTERTFLLRAVLASSIDGGVFLDIAFDPVFDLDPRVERR